MGVCKSCGKKIGVFTARVGELCPACFATHEANAKRDLAELPKRLAERFTGLTDPEEAAVGCWGVVNRQTLAKHVGLNLLYQAVGIPPFLVSAEYAGRIGLIAVKAGEVAIVELGWSPLDSAAQIREEHLRSLLRVEPVFPVTRAPFSAVRAKAMGNTLSVKGAVEIGWTVLASDFSALAEGEVRARALADRVNGIAGFPSTISLLRLLLEGGEAPPTAELTLMAANNVYVEDLFKKLHALRPSERQTLLARLSVLPGGFVSRVEDFLQRRSEDHDRRPIKSIAALCLGLPGAALAGLVVVIRSLNDDWWALRTGHFIQLFAFTLLAISLIVGGILGLRAHANRKWYQGQLRILYRERPAVPH